ncbi:hypothetical protein [Kitasatospora sp. NPDC004289]
MADVFVCARCESVLTTALTRVALPVHAHGKWGNGTALPVLMDEGTYAVDPEPSGPPWRTWEEIGQEEAAARGIHARLGRLSDGAPGAVLIAPGDGRAMRLVPELCEGYCCGMDRGNGPNMACAGCGELVACRIDECSYWQAVWLEPGAVIRRPVTGGGPERGWDSLATGPTTPVLEPNGRWNRKWEMAAGPALAHLLAACDGAPVQLPPGTVSTILGDALHRLLPQERAKGPARVLSLAGPGVTNPAPDIALVPRHPVTGEPWSPPNGAPTVPLDADLWAHLAHGAEEVEIPVLGNLPAGVLRDEPPRQLPVYAFQHDHVGLGLTLARLPAVRRPWLRELHEQLTAWWW